MIDELAVYREEFHEVIAAMKLVNADDYTIRQTFEQAFADYGVSNEIEEQ